MLFALRVMNGFSPTLCSVDDGTEGEGGGGQAPDPAAAGRLEAIKALRAEKQELAAKLEAIQAKQEGDRVKTAEEQGRFKELYQEKDSLLTATQQELEAYKVKEAARVEAQATKAKAAVEAVPEALRALVPAGLDADATLAQVELLRALAPGGPIGTLGGGGKLPKVQLEHTPAEKHAAEKLMQNHKMLSLPEALALIRTRTK